MLNLLIYIIRMEGSFQISIFFLATLLILQLGQFHILLPSSNSSFVNSERHYCKVQSSFSNSGLEIGTLKYMRESNFVDLNPQVRHCKVDLS